MIVAARICGGIDGRPFADGYMSANIRGKQPSTVLGQKREHTLPAGISSRHVAHTSGPTGSPPHSR